MPQIPVVTRYNVVRYSSQDTSSGAEYRMWTESPATEKHPILGYSYINKLRMLEVKSIVRPEVSRVMK